MERIKEEIQEDIYKIHENIFLLEDSIKSFQVINNNWNNIAPENKKFFSYIYHQQADRAVLLICKIFDYDTRAASLFDLLKINRKNAPSFFCEKEVQEIIRLQTIRGQYVAHTDKGRTKNHIYIWWCDYFREKSESLLKEYCRENDYKKFSSNENYFYDEIIKNIANYTPYFNNFEYKNVEVKKMLMIRSQVFANADRRNCYLFTGKLSEQDFVYSVFEYANQENIICKVEIGTEGAENINGKVYLWYKIVFGSIILIQPHLSEIYHKLDFTKEINLHHIEKEINKIFFSSSNIEQQNTSKLIHNAIADYNEGNK